MEDLTYYEPPARPAPKAGGEPTTRPTADKAEDAPKPVEPTKTPDPPKPRPTVRPRPKPRLPRYKLNGIMQGPEGGCAIVNGQFVREGETIDGAKVVKIRRYDVHIDVQGERVTLRM